MNNNQRDQRALLAHCKGVFSTSGWLNHGTTEDPLPYTSKLPDRDSFKGKQFGVAATKTGRTPSSYFDPKHKYLAEGAAFVDRWPYAEQQPEKLKGFGTGDFSRRDEYALTVAMEKYREQLRHETRVQRAAQERLGGKALPAAAGALQARSKKEAPLLFDLVFNKYSEFNSKVKHDTLNPTALSCEREYGPYKTMAAMAHAPPGAGAAGRPQHVHRPAIKEEFYRRSNVFFPNGCTAEPRGY